MALSIGEIIKELHFSRFFRVFTKPQSVITTMAFVMRQEVLQVPYQFLPNANGVVPTANNDGLHGSACGTKCTGTRWRIVESPKHKGNFGHQRCITIEGINPRNARVLTPSHIHGFVSFQMLLDMVHSYKSIAFVMCLVKGTGARLP